MSGSGHQPVDSRPHNCRNRIHDEGGTHVTSVCKHCQNAGVMRCPYHRLPDPPRTGSGVIPPKGGSSGQKLGDRPSDVALIIARLEAENSRLRTIVGLLNDTKPASPERISDRTGRVRVRTSWLGFAVLEEERECIGGMRKWFRVRGYRIVVE